MSEPTKAEAEATKETIRAALDVLQEYVGEEGRINATKMTTEIRQLRAERDALRRRCQTYRRALRQLNKAHKTLWRVLQIRAERIDTALLKERT